MLKSILLAGMAVTVWCGVALADDDTGGMFATPTGWGGFYVGINGTYAKGTISDKDTTFPDLPLTGGSVGGQAGYNFVLVDGVVAGIQGDMDWSNEGGKYGGAGTTIGNFLDATLTDKVKWDGALTFRLGVYNGPIMAYALGGVAVAGNTLDNLGSDKLEGSSPIESTIDQTHVGWTAGGGLSAKLGSFSSFLEYRYSDFGTADYSAAVGSTPVRLVDQQVRVGLNYHKQ